MGRFREKIANKILKYESDYRWYELCDEYGNINTEEDSYNNTMNEILNNLNGNINDLLKNYKDSLEEAELEDEKRQLKSIIKDLEKLNSKVNIYEKEME